MGKPLEFVGANNVFMMWTEHSDPTLKWYSSETRKGKEMACRMRFSFRVCSTCFSFTTYKRTDSHMMNLKQTHSRITNE